MQSRDVFSHCRAAGQSAGRAATDTENQHKPDHDLKSIFDLAYKTAYNQAYSDYEQAHAKVHGGSMRKRKTTKTRKIRRNFMR